MERETEKRNSRELANLKKEVSRLRNRLSLLGDLGARIVASLDPPSVLQAVLDAACRLTEARYGAVAVFDDDGRIAEFFTHGITSEERERIGDLPQGLGMLGWLQEVQHPVRLADLTKHPRSVGFPPNHPPMASFLGVPIRLGEETIGNLYLTEKEEDCEFTPEDEDLLVLFAAQAALAIRNSRQFIREQTARLDAEEARRDQARSQRALRQSQQQLRDVIDNTTAVIYIKDTEGRYIDVNRRYEELFDVTRESIRGKTDHDLFPKEIADPLRANDLKVLETGVPLELEEVVPHDDRLNTYISIKFLLKDDEDTPYAVYGISTDITDRKLAEHDLETERRRLNTLVQTSPVGVLVIEEGSETVLTINLEAQRLLEVSHAPDDRLQRYDQSVTCETADGRILAAADIPVRRALKNGETVRAEELRFRFDDGRAVPVLVNATPIYAGEGRISAAVCIIQDLTPLEELERLRSEFLGMVSHELRTPLTAIKGSAATVLGSQSPFDAREMREFFEIIDEQADRMRDLVNNLLDMTRIETGSFSVSREATDLGDILGEALTTFARGGGAQEIRTHVPDDLPNVDVDGRRIVQVLSNLLSNAGKFSPETNPIEVNVARDGAQVTVRVRDEGRGIPGDSLPHLFKKFSRVHDDEGSRLSGSGLGLAISKGIVEAHGGRIWADSPGEGQGSAFSFTLPVADAVDTSPTDVSRRADHLGRVVRAGERTRILAVDDEAQVLRYLQNTLNGAGYQPIVTMEPSEVTKLVESEEPQLVLLDLMLPGVSGFDLLEQIREISGVPVIFLSARDEEEDTARALKAGADDYITKPFSPSELVARIEASLRRRVLSDQLEVRPPFELEDMTIDFAARRVSLAGDETKLTATEYKLLYELATNAGRVLTHDQILQRVWGPEYSGETQLVRAFIRNLRRKLGDDAHSPRFIFTEPQVGYRMANPPGP